MAFGEKGGGEDRGFLLCCHGLQRVIGMGILSLVARLERVSYGSFPLVCAWDTRVRFECNVIRGAQESGHVNGENRYIGPLGSGVSWVKII